MLKKVCLVFISLMIIFGSSSVTYAVVSQQEQVKQLNKTAKQMLVAVQTKKPEQALRLIETLKSQLLALKYEGLTSIEGIQSLFGAVTRLQQSLIQVKPQLAQWDYAAKSVMLAVDVLSHQAQPMWLSYEKKVSGSFRSFIQSVKQQNKTVIFQNWNDFKTTIDLITPALEVQAKANSLDQWKAVNRYLDVRMKQSPIDYKGILRVEEEMNQLIRAIFNQDLHAISSIVILNEEQIHTWTYWTISIGAIIVTVLSYVGYRKFKNPSLSIRS